MLVPVQVGDQVVYMSVSDLDDALPSPHEDEEGEVALRRPKLAQVLDGLTAFASEFAGRFDDSGASKITVQFGCEVAVESGSFIAVIGKASAASTITVGLEWNRPDKASSKG